MKELRPPQTAYVRSTSRKALLLLQNCLGPATHDGIAVIRQAFDGDCVRLKLIGFHNPPEKHEGAAPAKVFRYNSAVGRREASSSLPRDQSLRAHLRLSN